MLWIATVVSNVGSWMSDVGINWSMLTLSADPLDIALVQAASSLPMFLFALPSGVMADIVDRRKYLLFSQLWVFIAAAGLTVLSFTGRHPRRSAGGDVSAERRRSDELAAVSGRGAGPGEQARAGCRRGAELARGKHQPGDWPRAGWFSAVARRAVDGVCPERAVRGRRGVGTVALASGPDRAASAAGAFLLGGAIRHSLRARRAGAAQRAGAHRGLLRFRQRGLGVTAAGGAPRTGLRPGGLRRNAGVHWPGRLPVRFCCRACASG